MNILLVMFTQSIPLFPPPLCFSKILGVEGKKILNEKQFGKLSQILIYLRITATNKIAATFLRAVRHIYNSND